MRRKPSSNNNYGKQRRNSQGRGQPRKNYGAAREKYITQARNALSSGDRVMAEYYFQHAEHCFRMMAEEGGNNPRQQGNAKNNQDDSQQDGAAKDNNADTQNAGNNDDGDAAEQLPAFITGGPAPAEDAPATAEAKNNN